MTKARVSLCKCVDSLEPSILVLPQMAICVLFKPSAKTLHICAGIVTGQCDNHQYIMCWQRRLWRLYTFAQAWLSLRRRPKYHVLAQMAICVPFIMRAAKAVASLHQQPCHTCATIGALYQCVKSAPSAL